MPFFTYILHSDILNKYYVGQTNDINERLHRHNQQMVKSTRNGIPWKLIFQTKFSSRAEAMNMELKIKKRGAKRFLESLES